MTPPPDETYRPHTYDGIREYDKRLPNWWLYTLYVTIVFWVGYWAYFEWWHAGLDGPEKLNHEMTQIEVLKLAASANIDDPSLWKMSRNPVFVSAGHATFTTTCASCHTEKMTGGIGPNLVDHLWIHGGRATEIYQTVSTGVLAKGMPAWGPVLGQKKATEVVAYILSHHEDGEPVEVQAAWVPIVAP